MSIIEFKFEDTRRPWRLNSVQFLPSLNLLVGISGVGKTRILNSLRAVCEAGVGRATNLINCEWSIRVHTEKGEYTWSASTKGAPQRTAPDVVAVQSEEEETDDDDEFEFERHERLLFTQERITRDGDEPLVLRDGSDITFKGNKLPRLKDSESVISLLQENDEISPLHEMLTRVRRSGAHRIRHSLFNRTKATEELGRPGRCDLDKLKNDLDLPFLMKTWIFQENFAEEFRKKIIDVYCEIFPTVKELKVGSLSEFSESPQLRWFSSPDVLEIALQEEGVKGWITSREMSSGMRRTLLHILELALAPTGTVILFDEYENSMGINCLPAVTEAILGHTTDLQFIVTSHHPYVISNISKEHWLVVHRNGSNVEAVRSAALPGLDTRSHQDTFIQLMNADTYREGIQ